MLCCGGTTIWFLFPQGIYLLKRELLKPHVEPDCLTVLGATICFRKTFTRYQILQLKKAMNPSVIWWCNFRLLFSSLAVSNNGNRKSVVFHDSIPMSIDAIIARHFSSAFWLMGKCGFFFGLPFFFPWLDSSNKMSEN